MAAVEGNLLEVIARSLPTLRKSDRKVAETILAGPERAVDMTLAALAEGPSILRGIAHLRGHETDRLAALTTEIVRLGGRAVETDDGIRIDPAPLHAGVWHSYADHRMATAGAIVGLRVPGVEVDDIGTTAKTLPGFETLWDAMLSASTPSGVGS